MIAAAIALAGLAAIGAYLDIRFRRLPNWLCLVALVAGLGQSWWQGGSEALLSAGLHMIVALAVGMVLFRLAIVGGGDAKFYAAMAAWFPLGLGYFLLLAVSFSGLLVLVGWMLVRRRLTRLNEQNRANPEFRKVPFGVAIALGAVLTFLGTGAVPS